jgi:hypothetical protein
VHQLADRLGWHRGDTTQAIEVGRAIVPPVHGRPKLSLRRSTAPRGSSVDSKLEFAIADDGPELYGFVIDMTVGTHSQGTGSAIWTEVVAAARDTGLRRVDLEAKEVGGWFWAKHGFELSHPQRDAASLMEHAAARLELLRDVGWLVAGWTEWFANPAVRTCVEANGLQALLAQLPREPVPAFDYEGHELPDRETPFVAMLLTGSRWSGTLAL